MEKTNERTLYNYLDPFETGYLKVSDIHTIYYEASGNKNGKPAIIFHGGPGSGSDAFFRGFFDPSEYLVVQMDQRGCGKSTPNSCLEENNTQNIAEDAEKIRKHLKIEAWQVVFGGSWGSTISLYYAQTYPEVCKSLILRGIFLCRKSEIQFLFQEGTSWLFPDFHDELRLALPEDQRNDILGNYYKAFSGNNEELKLKLARIWTTYELKVSRLFVDSSLISKGQNDKFATQFSKIETHFFINKGFLDYEDQLLDGCEKIKHIPTIIIQGRYDVVCPVKSAWELHKRLPNSTLEIIPDAGHRSTEKGITDGLVRATDKFKNLSNLL